MLAGYYIEKCLEVVEIVGEPLNIPAQTLCFAVTSEVEAVDCETFGDKVVGQAFIAPAVLG